MAITLLTVSISLIIGLVITSRSFEIVEIESKQRLIEMSSRIGTEFDYEVREVERLREQVNDLVESTMNLEELKKDPEYMEKYKSQLAPIIEKMAHDAVVSRSVYVFFSPELDGKPNDVWYADPNNTGEVTRQEEFSLDFYETDSPEKDWYFRAKELRRPYWTDPYIGNVYFDNHKIYVSHTAPIYIDNVFVGVAGADFYFDELKNRISDIKIYETGYATLFNQDVEAIIHPTLESGVSIRDIDNGKYAWLADEIAKSESVVEYVWIDGNEKMLASTRLLNDWIIAVAPNKDQVYKSVYEMKRIMYFFIGIGGFLATVIGLFLGRWLVNPIERIILDINIIGLGNYDTPIESRFRLRNDELGILANAVERMRQKQKESFDEIHEKNIELEERVLERTVELTRANEYLKLSLGQLEEQQAEMTLQNEVLEDALDTTRKTQKQLIESEKIASLGYLVGGIAHEINTPVGNSVTLVTFLQKESENIVKKIDGGSLRKNDLHDYLENAVDTTGTIFRNLKTTRDLVNRFKQLAADESKESIIHFNVTEYLQLILRSMGLPNQADKVTVQIDCDDDLEIYSDAGKFSQIFTNLISNSLKHGFEGETEGEIRIQIEKAKNELFIQYEDNGVGIEHSHLDSIYTPFFTTKFSGHTKGLGLNIVYNVVTKLFNGSIRCESEVGKGTTFFIKLVTSKEDSEI